jgi:cation:H+ antiporter
MVLSSALFILVCAYSFKKKKLDRFEGVILILMEVSYMWYLISNI